MGPASLVFDRESMLVSLLRVDSRRIRGDLGGGDVLEAMEELRRASEGRGSGETTGIFSSIGGMLDSATIFSFVETVRAKNLWMIGVGGRGWILGLRTITGSAESSKMPGGGGSAGVIAGGGSLLEGIRERSPLDSGLVTGDCCILL